MRHFQQRSFRILARTLISMRRKKGTIEFTTDDFEM